MSLGAVLYVSDLARMRAFYEGCFGLVTREAAEDFTVLAAENLAPENRAAENADWDLTLVRIPAEIAATVLLTEPPARREDTAVKVVFPVADLEAIEATVTARGGRLDPIESSWEFRGYRHRDGCDPEGNIIQLRQPLPIA